MSDTSSHGDGEGPLISLWEWRLDHPFAAIYTTNTISLIAFLCNAYFLFDVHSNEAGIDQYILNCVVLLMLMKELSKLMVLCAVIGGDESPSKFSYVHASPGILLLLCCSPDLMDAVDNFVDRGTPVGLPISVDLMTHDISLSLIPVYLILNDHRDFSDLPLLISISATGLSLIRHLFSFILAALHKKVYFCLLIILV